MLIRGGDSYDPTRFTEDETYFEYGCDQADGLFCDCNYFNPDMLLRLPEKYEGLKKLPLSVAKKLSFADPYACAIFQLESGGMTKFMNQLQPSCLEDVMAGISMYRPGPMQFLDDFLKGKKNPDKVEYAHPLLKEVLEVTYGCIVYQEQIQHTIERLSLCLSLI